MIKLDNVTVLKAGVALFSDFFWTVLPNEHWVISGANGSGKTLLLELLAGNVHAADGEVSYSFIHGTDWDERFAERKEKILYVSAHAIQTFMRGHDLFYQQRYYSIGDERIPLVESIFGAEVARLHHLDFPATLNIDALLALPLNRLSNGQLKKVLILKSLVKQIPRVLLLDYPFEGLDHASRMDLIDFLDHIAAAHGTQIILVDHHHHLPAVINRRLVLRDFAIEAIETVEALADDDSAYDSVPADVLTDDAPPVVEMRTLRLAYGDRVLLDNFNWIIRRGERWALTGRNGSGKTTLFSLIYADHPMAYSQQVYLFGKRRGSGESIWDIKRRISYLGPEIITFLNPSGIQQSARAYTIAALKLEDAGPLDALVAFFDVASWFGKAVKLLSSGQLQLMFLMQYFLEQKELLLLDEPFQFLDPVQKERVNVYLQEHLEEGVTLVLITHYEADIRRWTRQRMSL